VVAFADLQAAFSLITGRCLEEPRFAVPAYMAEVRDGLIWVRAKPCRSVTEAQARLVVVGNGMRVRAIEELRGLAPQIHEHHRIRREPHGSYNRSCFTPVVRRKRMETSSPSAGVVRRAWDHPASPGSRGAHRSLRRCVRSRNGIEAPYDRLLIATGSLPILLPVPAAAFGRHHFSCPASVDTMLAATESRRHAVVIGGGLLGSRPRAG